MIDFKFIPLSTTMSTLPRGAVMDKDYYINDVMDYYGMNYGSSGKTTYREFQDGRYGSSERARYEDDQSTSSSFAGYMDLNEDGSYTSMESGAYKNHDDGRNVKGVGNNITSDSPRSTALPNYETVVLKVQIHCEECIRKVKKALAKMDGVDSVRVDEGLQRVTVTGKVDPQKVLKKAVKTGKSVELLTFKDPVNTAMSYDNLREKFFTGSGGYSSAGVNNTDKNHPILTYPASWDGGTCDFSEENVNSCSIM